MVKSPLARNRRTPEEIIDAIYDALSDQEFRTVAEISANGSVDWKTCDRYIKLILYIQNKHFRWPSWLETEDIGKTTGYKKKTERGPKSKS